MFGPLGILSVTLVVQYFLYLSFPICRLGIPLYLFYRLHDSGVSGSLRVVDVCAVCLHCAIHSSVFTGHLWAGAFPAAGYTCDPEDPPASGSGGSKEGPVVDLKSLSCVRLFATPWTVVPLSMGFPRQEYWSRLLSPFPGASSRPRDQTCMSCISRWILYH